MRRSNVDKPIYFRIGVIVCALVVLIVVGLVFLQRWEANRGKFSEHEFGNSTIEYHGNEYVLKEGVETFLVIGLDKSKDEATSDSYNNDQQADFLMLFVFDNEAKQCSAIQINRDTMVDVNVLGVAGNKVDTVTKQIALAHTYGNGRDVSCRNTADSVSSLLDGIKINHYISVTMDAVSVFNDLIGGVDLVVLDDFSGIDDTLVKGQMIRLNGSQAFNYVHSRSGLDDNTNISRMARQRQYIEALYEAFQNRVLGGDSEFIVDATLKMSDYIVSDRSVTQLQALGNKFQTYQFVGIETIDGESVVGEEFMEFYPEEEAKKQIIVDLFYIPKK